MHVFGLGCFTFCEPMDTRDDVVVVEMDVRPDEFDHAMDIDDDVENIYCENEKKRRKEESFRPFRQDPGNVTKKSRTQKRVHFADSVPTWDVDPEAMELDRPYDLTKSATEQGWVLKSPEYEIFCIHPRALRSMPDRDFIYFANQCPSFSMLRFSDGQEVTDFGFCQMIKGRFNLKAVDIALAPNLTNNVLYALVNHCPLLRDCSLLECPKVDDFGVTTLVKQCKGLRTLSLDWCYGITDESLYAIANYCPRLLELCLTEGTQFSLTAFKAVLQGCPWLEKLDLWSCTQSTDAWVDAIIQWGNNIKELDLKYCTNITPQAICRLKARFPTLNLIH